MAKIRAGQLPGPGDVDRQALAHREHDPHRHAARRDARSAPRRRLRRVGHLRLGASSSSASPACASPAAPTRSCATSSASASSVSPRSPSPLATERGGRPGRPACAAHDADILRPWQERGWTSDAVASLSSSSCAICIVAGSSCGTVACCEVSATPCSKRAFRHPVLAGSARPGNPRPHLHRLPGAHGIARASSDRIGVAPHRNRVSVVRFVCGRLSGVHAARAPDAPQGSNGLGRTARVPTRPRSLLQRSKLATGSEPPLIGNDSGSWRGPPHPLRNLLLGVPEPEHAWTRAAVRLPRSAEVGTIKCTNDSPPCRLSKSGVLSASR